MATEANPRQINLSELRAEEGGLDTSSDSKLPI